MVWSLTDRSGDLKWGSYVRVKMRVKKLFQTNKPNTVLAHSQWFESHRLRHE